MKLIACVNSLSSSSVHIAAIFSCRIGHVARYTPTTRENSTLYERNLMIN